MFRIIEGVVASLCPIRTIGIRAMGSSQPARGEVSGATTGVDVIEIHDPMNIRLFSPGKYFIRRRLNAKALGIGKPIVWWIINRGASRGLCPEAQGNRAGYLYIFVQGIC